MGIKERLLILFLGGIILGGCSQQRLEKENIKIRFANWESLPEQIAVWERVVDAFNQSHPGINIKYEPISGGTQPIIVQIAGGKAPDVFYWGTYMLPSLVKGDALVELTPFIEKDKINSEEYFPSTWTGTTLNGKVWGLPPYWGGTWVIAYNKNIFDAEGIPYPDDDWNWDEYLEIAKKLTKKEDGQERVIQFGTCPPAIWDMVYCFGSVWFDEKGNFALDSIKAKEAFAFIQNMRYKDRVSPDIVALGSLKEAHLQELELFRAGKVAMYSTYAWSLGALREIKSFRWDVVSPPKKSGIEESHEGESPLLVISKQSKNTGAAWEFVKFSCYGEGAKILAAGGNNISALKKYVGYFSPPPQHVSLYYRPVEKIIFSPGKLPIYSEWQMTVRDPEIEKLVLNMQTPEETIQNLKIKTENFLTEKKGK